MPKLTIKTMAGEDKLKKLAKEFKVDTALANDAQLWNFIVKALGESFKPAEIKNYLLSITWDEKKIDSTMREIRKMMEDLK